MRTTLWRPVNVIGRSFCRELMKYHYRPSPRVAGLARLLALACWLVSSPWVSAQPEIVSTVPPNMAAGVSGSTPVVFTFSEAMDPVVTAAQFMDASSSGQMLVTTAAWSAGNTVLTCTPVTPWPASHMIVWTVDGANPSGTGLGGTAAGMFTAGSSDTGCDTNTTMLSLTLSKGCDYDQSSSGAPTLLSSSSYGFLACMSLPCPRDATNVSLQLPGGTKPNMGATTIPGHLTLMDYNYASQTALDAAYPNGNYTFSIQAVGSNQQVTLTFPSTLAQPPAPHLSDFDAGQSINASQPFTLSWDAFSGGTASDYIYVELGGVFQTPGPGTNGALKGTVTSVVIPANTFQPNQSYPGSVTFYHLLLATNGASYVSLMYRATITEFTLNTAAASPVTMVLTNTLWSKTGGFSCDVSSAPGQTVVVERSADLLPGHWLAVVTNTCVSNAVHVIDPPSSTNSHLFYRARTGP